MTDATVAAPDRTPPARPAPPAPPAKPRPARTRRGRAPYVVGGLVAAALGTVLVLLAQSGDGGNGGSPPTASRPASEGGGLSVPSVDDFDPTGDDQAENPDLVANLIDGDPTTAWRTQCYRSASLAGFKPGVGFIVDLGTEASLDQFVLDTTTPGWSAEVHVADDTSAWSDPENLGAAAGTFDAVPAGTASAELDGADGRYVLLWITGFGQQPSSDCDSNPFGVTITELSLLAE